MSAAAPQRPSDIRAGILWMIVSTLMFAIMGAFGRAGMVHATFWQVSFFRSFAALIPVLGISLGASRRGGLLAGLAGAVRVRNPWLMLATGLLLILTLTTYFLSIHLLPLNDAIVLSFCNVPAMTALSGPILGERVGLRRWAAVAAGFCGILIIADPTGALRVGTIFGAISALSSASTWLLVRRYGTGETSVALTVWMLLVSALGCAVVLPFAWAPADARLWGVLLMVGILGGLAQLPMAHAYRIAPTAAVAPFYYCTEIWIFFIAYAVWGELPGWRTVLGGGVIIGAALFLLLSERRAARA